MSFELMMLEGPAFQGAISRLAAPDLNLAAWGLTMSLALIIESPVIMLLATAIALVRNSESYCALRQFTLHLIVGCTVVAGIIAFTPLYDVVCRDILAQPVIIVEAARPALQIMLFWTAAIAWRRFYQGILIRHGHVRAVTLGTAIRLTAALGTVWLLTARANLPGVQVAACAVMAAVVAEALATSLFAVPVLRGHVARISPTDEPLRQADIWRFHAPLAATTLLTLVAHPLTSAALARLEHPTETLAAWPVAYMVLLVIRGGPLALQEISVAVGEDAIGRRVLSRFTWLIGIGCSFVAVCAYIPQVFAVYADGVLHLPVHLQSMARQVVGLCFLLPLVTALGSTLRGELVANGSTKTVYRSMAISLTVLGVALVLGVLLRLPGMLVASGAMMASALVEYLYLAHGVKRVGRSTQG